MIDFSEVAAQYGGADDQMLAGFDYAVAESVGRGEGEDGLLVCTDGGNYLVSSEHVFYDHTPHWDAAGTAEPGRRVSLSANL